MKPEDIIGYLWADGTWVSEDDANYDGMPSYKSDDFITVTWGTPLLDISSWVGEALAITFLKEALGYE